MRRRDLLTDAERDHHYHEDEDDREYGERQQGDTAAPLSGFFAGRLLAVTGHTTLRVDAAGETIVGVRGRTVELCEVLAG